MQFSKLLRFVEDNDTASTSYNKKGRQYDFNNSTFPDTLTHSHYLISLLSITSVALLIIIIIIKFFIKS